MKVDEFLVERWMNEYEHNVKYNLAETCVDPFSLAEILDYVDKPDFFEDFKHKKLTYGYIEGNPSLRVQPFQDHPFQTGRKYCHHWNHGTVAHVPL